MFSGVTGSFDPNVVLAYPVRNGNPRDGGKIIRYEDNTITYQIFFQNTGNAPANQVMVYDTVDTDLNLASMRNITATHEMKIQTNADGNVLIFKFDNINLVDSTSDYASSIGSVQFDVDLKPGLDLGTKIDNTAAIFFDFNSPVITNTNVLELTSATAVHQPLSNDAVAITPNPADQYTSVYCDKACKMRLYNAVGKLISTQMLEGGLNQVNTSELPAGVYMVQLETEGAFKSGKIVVSH